MSRHLIWCSDCIESDIIYSYVVLELENWYTQQWGGGGRPQGWENGSSQHFSLHLIRECIHSVVVVVVLFSLHKQKLQTIPGELMVEVIPLTRHPIARGKLNL